MKGTAVAQFDSMFKLFSILQHAFELKSLKFLRKVLGLKHQRLALTTEFDPGGLFSMILISIGTCLMMRQFSIPVHLVSNNFNKISGKG